MLAELCESIMLVSEEKRHLIWDVLVASLEQPSQGTPNWCELLQTDPALAERLTQFSPQEITRQLLRSTLTSPTSSSSAPPSTAATADRKRGLEQEISGEDDVEAPPAKRMCADGGNIDITLRFEAKDLECCVCREGLTSAVFQCRQGPHYACGDCNTQLRAPFACPLCRQEGPLMRNVHLERQLRGFSRSCKFAPNGCTRHVFTWSSDHESICEFQPQHCVFCDQHVVCHPVGRVGQHLLSGDCIFRSGQARMRTKDSKEYVFLEPDFAPVAVELHRRSTKYCVFFQRMDSGNVQVGAFALEELKDGFGRQLGLSERFVRLHTSRAKGKSSMQLFLMDSFPEVAQCVMHFPKEHAQTQGSHKGGFIVCLGRKHQSSSSAHSMLYSMLSNPSLHVRLHRRSLDQLPSLRVPSSSSSGSSSSAASVGFPPFSFATAGSLPLRLSNVDGEASSPSSTNTSRSSTQFDEDIPVNSFFHPSRLAALPRAHHPSSSQDSRPWAPFTSAGGESPVGTLAHVPSLHQPSLLSSSSETSREVDSDPDAAEDEDEDDFSIHHHMMALRAAAAARPPTTRTEPHTNDQSGLLSSMSRLVSRALGMDG